ncbi:hypothetical protein GCM10010390_16620 [Streptomyces mordarskii]|uniref:Uncharacterized protein n=1 Tax=Streptomyces mordarskii TaxID=1226758 RepID=A0ABN1CB09_9ACTN
MDTAAAEPHMDTAPRPFGALPGHSGLRPPASSWPRGPEMPPEFAGSRGGAPPRGGAADRCCGEGRGGDRSSLRPHKRTRKGTDMRPLAITALATALLGGTALSALRVIDVTLPS